MSAGPGQGQEPVFFYSSRGNVGALRHSKGLGLKAYNINSDLSLGPGHSKAYGSSHKKAHWRGVRGNGTSLLAE